MKKYLIAIVTLLAFTAAPALAFAPSVSSPTCTLNVSPVPIELLRTTPITITWNSTGGTNATLKVDAWSQPNIYSTTGLNGNVTIPVTASMGLATTLTVTNSNGGTAICKVGVPMFFIPKK